MNRRTAAALALLVCGLGLLYWNVLSGLVAAWSHSDDYSHGFLVAPACLYFAWERRHEFAALEVKPATVSGALLVAAGLLLFAAGTLGAEPFLRQLSLPIVICGSLLFVLGVQHVRVAALPLAFSTLMIPLPAIVFNEITFPLQLLASRTAEFVLTFVGIPVLREGNVIVLANTTLEVAQACSGIRSLVSLLALGIVYGHFVDLTSVGRTILAITTVPIAVVANALRVAGTGVAAHFVGAAAAEGFLHAFSGWLVFILATLLLVAVERALAGAVRMAGPPTAVDVV